MGHTTFCYDDMEVQSLIQVDSQKPVEFLVAMEGFVGCQGCTVSMETVGMIQGLGMDTVDGRRLRLTVTSEMLGGTALKVSSLLLYWCHNYVILTGKIDFMMQF